MATADDFATFIERGLQHPDVIEQDWLPTQSLKRKCDVLELALIGKYGDPKTAFDLEEETYRSGVPPCVELIYPDFSISTHTRAHLLGISYELADSTLEWHGDGSDAHGIVAALRSGELQP